MQPTILIVDDKIKLCQALAQTFEQLGYHALFATNGADALRHFSTQPVRVVLLDIMLGEENGIDVLQQCLQRRQDVPIIMITGYASVETAVQSLKLGAFDYVKKPLDFEQLVKVVEHALAKKSNLNAEIRLVKSRAMKSSASSLITQNADMLAICENAKKLASTALPILIEGENGTGKEIVADVLHVHSPRHQNKMHKVNCAAFPENLLDNELFGHEKGAYTGASSEFKGVFERADKSTLFLDEIGDMPLTIQAKILRTLQNHEIRRLGGTQTRTINVRFIAATNKNLPRLIREEKFRQDLYYRLKAAVIHIPPLRERKEDIPLLIEYFLSEYSQVNATPVKHVGEAVQQAFFRHEWPGNIRELKNVVNYAAAISAHTLIELNDLPPDFPVDPQAHAPDNLMEEAEKKLIVGMLQKTEYNKKRTAELLNIGRKTLYRKIKKYGIPIP